MSTVPRLLLPLVLISLSVPACDDKPIAPPPFTPTMTSTPTVTPTAEPSLPPPSTKTPGPVRKWVKGKLTVQVLDAPDPNFPEPAQNMGQVIFTCGYEPKSTQSVLTGLNEPWMNKTSETGDYLNGPAYTAIVAAFYSAYGPIPAIFTRDSWPVLMPQEDSVPLPEISTAYQVTRDKLKLDGLLKVKAVYTAGCMADLKPGLPADVEIWASWDWQAELK